MQLLNHPFQKVPLQTFVYIITNKKKFKQKKGAVQKVQLAVVEPFDRLRNHLSKPPYLVQWSLLIGQPLSSILLFRSSSAVKLSFYLAKLIFTVCALQVLVRTKPVTFRIFCPLYFPVNKQNYRSKE